MDRALGCRSSPAWNDGGDNFFCKDTLYRDNSLHRSDYSDGKSGGEAPGDMEIVPNFYCWYRCVSSYLLLFSYCPPAYYQLCDPFREHSASYNRSVSC